MKEIKFNGKPYNIVSCWCEVSIKMVVKSGELNEMLPDLPIITIISSYLGIPIKELTVAKKDEVEEILKLMEFIYEPYEPTPSPEFEFRGEKYAAELDIQDQSFGDFVSIQTILYNYREKPLEGLPRMIAVLCKKDGESVDDINLDDRALLFEELPITTAKDVEGFFLHSQRAYSAISQLSLTIPEMEKSILSQLTELKRIMKVQKARTGGFSLTRLWIGYYQIYLWYFEKLWERYFNSTHTEVSRKNWKQTLKKFFTRPSRRRNK